MQAPKITVRTHTAEPDATSLSIFPVAKGDPHMLGVVSGVTGLAESLLGQDFRAEVGELYRGHFVSTDGNGRRLLLAGLGDVGKPGSAFKSGRAVGRHLREMRVAAAVLHLDHLAERIGSVLEPLLVGIRYGWHACRAYRTGRLRPAEREAPAETSLDLFCHASVSEMVTGIVHSAEILADAQTLARDLVDAPANRLTPTRLAEIAVDSGRRYGYDVHVLWKNDIEAAGLHALLAVNRGSAEPPAFIVMEYNGTAAADHQPIVLVGKGVTFDTGGVSLKRSENLHFMKSDMGGAAAVIAATEAVARLGLPLRLVTIVPATDNKTGSNAQNPGDIINTYAGLTVEVEDTDAEGRLILADAIAYACDRFSPAAVVDLATLTGAIVVALGSQAAGLFSNDDELAGTMAQAGEASGERVWRLPSWPEYDQQIQSDLADLKNLGGRPAGSITAAKFLEKFVSEGTPWAHIDIAGTVLTTENGTIQRSASGYGVQLLVNWLRGEPRR